MSNLATGESRRRQAVKEEQGSCALEGIKPSPLMKELTSKYISGELTIEQAVKKTKEHYGYEPL
jgi:hypothetical protein